jgi:hypothetical protein
MIAQERLEFVLIEIADRPLRARMPSSVAQYRKLTQAALPVVSDSKPALSA